LNLVKQVNDMKLQNTYQAAMQSLPLPVSLEGMSVHLSIYLFVLLYSLLLDYWTTELELADPSSGSSASHRSDESCVGSPTR
jgi:hypothetical protein